MNPDSEKEYQRHAAGPACAAPPTPAVKFAEYSHPGRMLPDGRAGRLAQRLLRRVDALLLPALGHFSGAVAIEAHRPRTLNKSCAV